MTQDSASSLQPIVEFIQAFCKETPPADETMLETALEQFPWLPSGLVQLWSQIEGEEYPCLFPMLSIIHSEKQGFLDRFFDEELDDELVPFHILESTMLLSPLKVLEELERQQSSAKMGVELPHYMALAEPDWLLIGDNRPDGVFIAPDESVIMLESRAELDGRHPWGHVHDSIDEWLEDLARSIRAGELRYDFDEHLIIYQDRLAFQDNWSKLA